MDLLARLFASSPGGGAPGPTDDFWYKPVGVLTAAGLRIDAEGANKLSAWFRGRWILGTTLAMLPLNVYQRLPDDRGATVARSNPLYDCLHRKPNACDDSFVWRQQGQFDLIDHGWFYNRIGIGTAWTLERIDPTRVTPERVRRGGESRWLFHVRDERTAQTTTLTQDEVFYLRAPDGKGILERARESLGLAVAMDQYASRVFGRGTLNGGLIKVPGPMNPESARAMAESFVTAAGDWHMPKVLPQGSDWIAQDGLTPDKAQMLLSRKFSVTDIARWLGLPPHMIGDLERATFSNIEHQGQEFVTYSLGPWLSLWESAINDQLILQPNRFYAEFVRDALVRGDIAARWNAYQVAVTTGTFTRNEVRRLENKNALDGLDTPLDPAHLTGKPPASKSDEPPAREDDEPDENAEAGEDATSKAERITRASAARLLKKEIAEVQKLAVRHASSQDAFAAAVAEFYQGHVARVQEWLQLSAKAAESYCAGQAGHVLADWLSALDEFGTAHYAAGVAGWALEEVA